MRLSLRLPQRRDKVVLIIVLLLSISYFAYGLYYITTSGLVAGEAKYVSDECWYVSAARNLLRKVFGLEPNSCAGNLCYASIFVNTLDDANRVKEYVISNGGFVVKDNYAHKVLAGYEYTIAVKAPRQVLYELAKNYTVIIGYPYPDWDDVANYLNLEHPPLMKYIVMVTLLVSDNPVAWKIPSLIAGSLILFLAYLIAKKVFNDVAGLLAAVIVFVEPVTRAMSMVAMLDIYVALFSILALYFAVSSKYLFSGISVGLAGSVKMNGFYHVLSMIISAWRNRRISNIRLLLYAIIIPLTVYVVVNIPLIIYEGGIMKWIDLQLWALSWHTQSRPPGGPPVANPWDWFLARNSFPLHYNPDLAANPSPPLMLLTIPLTIILIPLAWKEKVKGAGSILAWFWIPITMFTVLFMIGNRTQYSFYSVQVTPVAAIIASASVFFVYRKDLLQESISSYRFEQPYRIGLMLLVGLSLWLAISYMLPGLLGIIAASIVLGLFIALGRLGFKAAIIVSIGAGILAPMIIYFYYWLYSSYETIRYFEILFPYNTIPVIASAIVTVASAMIFMLLLSSRQYADYVEEEIDHWGE